MQCARQYCAATLVLTTGLLILSGLNAFAQTVEQAPLVAPVQRDVSSKSLLNTDSLDFVMPPYKPITLKQKYIYSLEQMFSGPHLVAILARSALDQVEVTPHRWGSDAPALGIRVASQFGRSFVRATIASGIRAIDHEDPRYFYSHKTNPWDRTKYALVHTFEVHNDNGSMMPAYSRFIGDFGMPFLAQTWHPNGINTPDALRSGCMAIGMGMGLNVAQEFWPDLRHALHLGPGLGNSITPGTVH
jgi:hypothetical protein